MRRLFAVLLCIFLLSTTVYAENTASSYAVTATVSPTGSCQVVVNTTIRLDSPVDNLTFPIGTDVSSVTLNGGRAGTTTVGGVTHVRLGYLDGQTGSFPITLQYTVGNVVQTDEDGRQIVHVPLLSGFKYPVQTMQFSVTMPGAFTDSPVFFSGYHEQDIERILAVNVNGVTVTGATMAELKDSETMYMQLEAPAGMFPLAAKAGQSLWLCHIVMAASALLALGYWLATMRRMPFLPGRCPTAPEGLSAGSIGTYLVHAPADLSLTVIQWAQRGYLEIQVDRRGRVFLIRKMDMGNERSAFEGKCFASLFTKGDKIDTASHRYARLCEQVAASSRRKPSGLLPSSGNPTLFRILACGIPLAAGAAMGDSIAAPSPVWRIVWMILLALFSAFACWRVQQGMARIHLCDRLELAVGLGYGAALLIVSALCGAFFYGGIAVGWALLTGVMAAYGGLRDESGRHLTAEILGLRRFLRTASPSALQRILRSNPEYYYELAPFALALGVDRQFARHFGDTHLHTCRWLLTDLADPDTPAQWYPLLRYTVRLMRRTQQRPLWKVILNLR